MTSKSGVPGFGYTIGIRQPPYPHRRGLTAPSLGIWLIFSRSVLLAAVLLTNGCSRSVPENLTAEGGPVQLAQVASDSRTPTVPEPTKAETKTSPLRTYELKMSSQDLMRMQNNPYGGDTFPATFVANGETYPDVKVRHRGAWARSWPKKPIKIFLNETKKYEGRERINLNSCWHDPSFIRENLAYLVYEACGTPASRAEMVRLLVNGQFYGLYVDVEQPDKAFLKRNKLKGASIYKAASQANQADERRFGTEARYKQHYEKETQKEEGYRELMEFCQGLDGATDIVEFFDRNVDVDKYVNYLAASTLIQNWDGYNKNHFLLYDGKESKKWFVLPWDLDRTFGDHWNWSFSEARLPIFLGTRQNPGVTGWNRMADRFIGEPTLRARFLARLKELLDTEFTEEKLFPKIDQLQAAIKEDAPTDRRRWPSNSGDFRNGISEVKRYVKNRRAFLLRELAKL